MGDSRKASELVQQYINAATARAFNRTFDVRMLAVRALEICHKLTLWDWSST